MKKVKIPKEPMCVMCLKTMTDVAGKPDVIQFPFCNHERCPNYRLLQIPLSTPIK